jgi:hypothetical protein
MGMGEACTGSWFGNLRERDHWGDPYVDGRIMLRWNFRNWDVGVWTGLGWLKVVADTCEWCNKPSGPIKCREFLD